VNIAAAAGETAVLLGPNGTGKSTIIKFIRGSPSARTGRGF
jgi:Fe-S cluster assembly ATPase SufC